MIKISFPSSSNFESTTTLIAQHNFQKCHNKIKLQTNKTYFSNFESTATLTTKRNFQTCHGKFAIVDLKIHMLRIKIQTACVVNVLFYLTTPQNGKNRRVLGKIKLCVNSNLKRNFLHLRIGAVWHVDARRGRVGDICLCHCWNLGRVGLNDTLDKFKNQT